MMSGPVPVPAVCGTVSTLPLLSSSPRQQHSSPASSARKFFKRLQYDVALDTTQFTVGLLETREQAERKSGAEAWSLRLHSTLTELSFTDFVARFEGEDIPFHRIVWFKQNGVIVWEAENLKSKGGGGMGDSTNHHHPNHGHHGSSSSYPVPPATVLGSSFTGCSPPAGSFMARLAAGAAVAASTSPAAAAGLPPRAASIPLDHSNGGGASSSYTGAGSGGSTIHWKPQRHSATDYTGSPSSWGGPGHWSSAAVASGGGLAAAAGGVSGSCYGQSPAGQSPLLGTSPVGSLANAVYGTSPKLAGSWTGGSGSLTGGILSSSFRGGGSCHISPSPGGSCSSSWTGTSPLAAAAAAGAPLLPRSSKSGGEKTPVGNVALTACLEGVAGDAAALQEQLLALQEHQQHDQLQGGEEIELADYSMLPEECWVDILQRLGVKELCYMSRVSRSLRSLAARPFLWSSAYERLFGTAPPADWSGQTIKRLCRRSELRASRWLEADVEGRPCGFAGTWCCQLDDTKVVSGDGCCVRLWSHDTGRRIATLRGHTGRVTAVAFDDDLIISGCSQGTVKLWSMDELKLSKTLRHHTDAVSATALLHGLPISASKDGSVCIWDAAAPNSPLVVLEAGGPVQALQLQEERGHLITASSSLGVWDMNTTQLLFNLSAPTGLTRASSSASLAAAAAASAGEAGSVDSTAGSGGDGDGLDGADAADGVLLHDGWLEVEEDNDNADNEGADGGAAAAGAGQHEPRAKPFTSVTCHGNLVAAGRAGSVVLWDTRSQDPVGAISPAGASRTGSGKALNLTASTTPCIGVQLDDWKLVTGWAGSDSGSSGGNSSSCWWRSSSENIAGAVDGLSAVGHSLEVYDIRAAASFSSCNVSSSSSAGGSSSAAAAAGGCGRGGMWSMSPILSLPVPNRITCFQFHGQNLLVGQEGAECALLSFNPPCSSSSRAAAAAWGYGGSSVVGSYGAAGTGVYGMSPGGSYGYDEGGNVSEGGGGGRSGSKGKKKGAAKVPAKKQTRYPKRTTR